MRLRDALAGFVRRLDTWQNPITGFGTGRDKTTYSAFVPFTPLSDQQLSDLYHGDDLAARMIDVIPQEIFREGFSVGTGDTGLDETVKARFDALGAREKLLEAMTWGRLYGGAAVLMGADDGRPASTPLIPERARSLEWLYVLDRRYLFPLTYYGELGHPKFGEPETYLIATSAHTTSQQVSIHESRLVLFRGARTGIRERQQLSSWDLSVLQRPYEVLRQFNTGWKAVEVLLTDGNQAILKMSGLAEMIASGERSSLEARLEILDMYRSALRALVIDADNNEGFERQAVSFADIPSVLDKYMLRLAAAVQMPVTILMGQSPAGMNATGESDFRWFYDRVRSEQTNAVAPSIQRLADVLVRARDIGVRSASLNVQFPSLWQESPAQQAQLRKAVAETDQIYVNTGVLLPEDVALSRFREAGWSPETSIDRAAREAIRKEELKRLARGEPETTPPEPEPIAAA